MKKIILYSFISLFLMASCRKSDNPKIPDIAKVPVPLITKDNSADLTISAQNPDLFNGKIVVGLFFPEGIKPAKFDVVAIKNGSKASVKVIATDVVSFPTTISITGVQLKTLFGGIPIAAGDKFDFGINITTTDGKLYLAYPPVGEPYSPGASNPAGSSLNVRYEAICSFNITDYGAIGSTQDFIVQEDGWADYAAGATIPVKIVSSDSFSFEYASNNPKPIVIKVDGNTNETSVASVVYGDYGAATGDISAKSIAGSADNYVGPCDLIISVKLNHSSEKGNFGDGVIRLKKK